MPHLNWRLLFRSFWPCYRPIRLSRRSLAPAHRFSYIRHRLTILLTILFVVSCGSAQSALAANRAGREHLSATPPMGWNDWAHYQCGYTAQTILDNARALVDTGLAARGYKYVTIDDCWMLKSRDKQGNLQPNPEKFPHGIKPVIKAIHALGLKFGIYEDAGFMTCAGFAASGWPKGGGNDHFLQDARLFASWGVDYLKLDGCNVYVKKGQSQAAAYRQAYKAESKALDRIRRPIVFLESAPAYFQGTPEWYDVLHWAGHYGQLWREGTDIETYDTKDPNRSRFHSVLWNYAYNLPLGRFQKPGNWNNADFIIGGDHGMTLAETRSQVALWSMMSSPLILSSNIQKLNPADVAVLGNKAVISVDQDPLGRMATLIRRTHSYDLLFKQLQGGDYAVAVLNRSSAPLNIRLRPSDLGFTSSDCRLTTRNLWTGADSPASSTLQSHIAPHDTTLWKIHPSAACGSPARKGTITRILPQAKQNPEDYTRCLAATGAVEACSGAPAESWTVTPSGRLKNADKCLAANGGQVRMERCQARAAQRWTYTLPGQLVNRKDHLCLTGSQSRGLTLARCGHNPATQIWSLPTSFLHE